MRSCDGNPSRASLPGRKARTWLRFAHTGEVYGLAGQTVAGLVTAGGAVLVWTGLALRIAALPRMAETRARGNAEGGVSALDAQCDVRRARGA